jgi:rare lipoprotein A (peptidoglycan hydrolase)
MLCFLQECSASPSKFRSLMSNKVWISLTAASATVLLHPLVPAVAGSQTTQVFSPLPPATITELSVTELPTQVATVQPPTKKNLQSTTEPEIPVVAFGIESNRPEEKVRRSILNLGSTIKKQLNSSNKAVTTIQPVKIPQYFSQPSSILGVPASKERRTDSSEPSGSWGPLDSVEPTGNPEVTVPSENVLQTQTGQASWYGYEAGNMTATGERYNARALTAAHKTLPFGTRVRVTNLRNSRSVVVRINDRGPYIRGRIIDLSAAAAEQVGLTTSGVAKVRVDILSYGSGKRKSRR